ncbi:hypothetical protein Q9L42_020220 (plasmid) [Methylomarinum sp. Ch1-1]|uniref:Uncharacterized protein n=1 Tax=Methylomarinum roseum TaxID=3067653 RepID=A0AAU7P068_9GAMM|nr:hypothetical protein [Methylomarinum sp. Ch1-1]MDP4523242.1 hypothetical protein [Methylomarinum sp. Ch1-1]
MSATENNKSVRYSLNAKSTFSMPALLSPEADSVKRNIEAAIGRNIIEGRSPLHWDSQNNTYRLDFWAVLGKYEAIHQFKFRPDERKIDIELNGGRGRRIQLVINVPGEIVGSLFNSDKKGGESAIQYGGIYFSLEPGERIANLFELTDMLSKAIVMASKELIPSDYVDLENQLDEPNDEDNQFMTPLC